MRSSSTGDHIMQIRSWQFVSGNTYLSILAGPLSAKGLKSPPIYQTYHRTICVLC